MAQEEIFGPVLTVVSVAGEAKAILLRNDTIYGLNASVFTNDVDRARQVAAGFARAPVGHNAMRSGFGIAFGGFKQSGVGRERGREGILPHLEATTVILERTRAV